MVFGFKKIMNFATDIDNLVKKVMNEIMDYQIPSLKITKPLTKTRFQGKNLKAFWTLQGIPAHQCQNVTEPTTELQTGTGADKQTKLTLTAITITEDCPLESVPRVSQLVLVVGDAHVDHHGEFLLLGYVLRHLNKVKIISWRFRILKRERKGERTGGKQSFC